MTRYGGQTLSIAQLAAQLASIEARDLRRMLLLWLIAHTEMFLPVLLVGLIADGGAGLPAQEGVSRGRRRAPVGCRIGARWLRTIDGYHHRGPIQVGAGKFEAGVHVLPERHLQNEMWQQTVMVVQQNPCRTKASGR